MNGRPRVLDLGTGSGNLELEFYRQAAQIVGVDYNDEALRFLQGKLDQSKVKNVLLIQEDIRSLTKTARTGQYDCIVMIDVIEHVTKADGKLLADKIFRLTAKGGKACIITPNYKPLWIGLETILDKVSAVPKLAGEQHLAKYDPKTLGELFRQAGFGVETITTFNTLSWLIPSRKAADYVCQLELQAGWNWGNLVLGVFTKPDTPDLRK